MHLKPTGRPSGPRRGPPRRAGADLHAHAAHARRLLALRVLERVQRAGAYADVLLHSQLARSGLGPVDRAFATELVYGTLRWRGRIDYLLGRFLDRPLDRLEGIAATRCAWAPIRSCSTTACRRARRSTRRCAARARRAPSA
jgi:hypothetical protein